MSVRTPITREPDQETKYRTLRDVPRAASGLPAGRRSEWVMLLAVVGVLMLAGPLAGQIQDVEDNGPTSALPRGFDSTLVEEELPTFARSGVMPTVAVYERAGGLTPADREAIAGHREPLSGLAAGGELAPTRFSNDGEAALTVFGYDMQDGGFEAFEQIREAVGSDLPAGLDALVTGQSAGFYDQVAFFDGLNTRILGASVLVVAILLLLTYRSPALWLLPLIGVGVATVLSEAVIYGLAKHADLPVDGQSGGLLPILVFGVGTDYALLLVARYREELHLHRDRHVAMAAALRRCWGPIVASAATVVLGLSCLLLADLNSTRSLGAVSAVGVACAAVAMLVVLPMLLVLLGRWVFWPFVPRPDSIARSGADVSQSSALWRRVAGFVAGAPRRIWVGTATALAVLALGVLTTSIGVSDEEQYRTAPESVTGQAALEDHFPAGSSAPAAAIANASAAEEVQATVAATPRVTDVTRSADSPDGSRILFSVVMDSAPDSAAARGTVTDLRDRLHGLDGADALVGGDTAQEVDVASARTQDALVVAPVVLGVVLLVLILLLRAVVGPLVLLATVVLSFGAAMGAGALAMNAMGFGAVDVSLPLLAFVFLVALGVDYTIFLMSRVREEVKEFGHAEGVRRGLVATGAVITSAGLVLAGTFSVLIVMPIVGMIGLGTVIALGILIDTFVVRSLLVPALATDIGERFWWPSRL